MRVRSNCTANFSHGRSPIIELRNATCAKMERLSGPRYCGRSCVIPVEPHCTPSARCATSHRQKKPKPHYKNQSYFWKNEFKTEHVNYAEQMRSWKARSTGAKGWKEKSSRFPTESNSGWVRSCMTAFANISPRSHSWRAPSRCD